MLYFIFMALTKCPECGQQVSDRAKKCPHCGYVLSTDNIKIVASKKKASRFWLLCGILLVAVLGVVIFSLPKTNTEALPNQSDTKMSADELPCETIEITPELSERISKFIQVSDFSDNRAAVMTEDYKWGFIDTKGDLVIPARYKGWPDSPKFSDGLAYVETEHDKSYIDTNGKVVIKLSKDDVGSHFVNGKAVVYTAHQNEDWSFTIGKALRVINKQGETINEIPIPDGINLIDDGIGGDYPVTLEITQEGILFPADYFSKLRLYDYDGNYRGEYENNAYTADPSKFDYVVFEEERGVEGHNITLRGIIDKQGNIVLPAKNWHFPNTEYNYETRARYINPRQGLFLVVLEESPSYLKNVDDKRYMDESTEASYFGFVNLNGEDTFSPERWERQKIQSYNIQNNITTY